MLPSSRPVEAVFLDAGGVLNLPAPAESGRFLAAHGADGAPEAIERCHYHGMLAYDDAPAGSEEELSRAYLAGFVRAAGLDPGLAVEFRAAIRGAGWQPAIRSSLDVLPELGRLARLAIVSNSDGTVGSRLAAAGVLQVGAGPGVRVEAVVDSGAVGVEKPDPRIFRFALEACRVAPAAAVHVGDSRRTDVAGALAAGIRPLHLDPLGLCPDRSHEHLHSLGEVLELLGA